MAIVGALLFLNNRGSANKTEPSTKTLQPIASLPTLPLPSMEPVVLQQWTDANGYSWRQMSDQSIMWWNGLTGFLMVKTDAAFEAPAPMVDILHPLHPHAPPGRDAHSLRREAVTPWKTIEETLRRERRALRPSQMRLTNEDVSLPPRLFHLRNLPWIDCYKKQLKSEK